MRSDLLTSNSQLMVDGPNTLLGVSVQKPVGEGARSALVPVQIPHPPTGERNVLGSPGRPGLAGRLHVLVSCDAQITALSNVYIFFLNFNIIFEKIFCVLFVYLLVILCELECLFICSYIIYIRHISNKFVHHQREKL